MYFCIKGCFLLPGTTSKPCPGSPCLNNATCIRAERKCLCRVGYLGEYCGEPVNDPVQEEDSRPFTTMIVLICVLAILILSSVAVAWCMCRYCAKQKSEPLYSDRGGVRNGDVSFQKGVTYNSSTFSSNTIPTSTLATLNGNGHSNGNGNGNGNGNSVDTFSY